MVPIDDDDDTGQHDVINDLDDEEDVFSGDDSVSMTTSSDSLELLLASTPGDEELEDTRLESEVVVGGVAAAAAAIRVERRSCCSLESPPSSPSSTMSPARRSIDLNDVTSSSVWPPPERHDWPYSATSDADVPDDDVCETSSASMSQQPSSSLQRCASSSAAFRQRRLGQLRLYHRLAIDLPDYSPLQSASSRSSIDDDDDEGEEASLRHDPVVALSASRSSTSASAAAAAVVSPTCPSSLSTPCGVEPGDVFLVAQDLVLSALDNPAVRFYTVFVAVSAALANAFDVQPSWLILFVAFASFVSFYLFGHRISRRPSVCNSTNR